jgi:hypothetical protein
VSRSRSGSLSILLWTGVAIVAVLALVQTISFGRRQSALDRAPRSVRSVLARTIVGRELSWVRRVLLPTGVEVDVVSRSTVRGAYPWDAVAAVADEEVDSRGRVHRVALEVERSPRPPLMVGRPHEGGCDTSPVRIVRDTFGPVLGAGPLLLGGPSARGVLRVEPGPTQTRRSYVFMFGTPNYSGPLLVRGGRWGRPGGIFFEQQGAEGTGGARTYGSRRELHLPPGDGLRAWGATLTFPSTGCFALQVDGPNAHDEIVFKVKDEGRG